MCVRLTMRSGVRSEWQRCSRVEAVAVAAVERALLTDHKSVRRSVRPGYAQTGASTRLVHTLHFFAVAEFAESCCSVYSRSFVSYRYHCD